MNRFDLQDWPGKVTVAEDSLTRVEQEVLHFVNQNPEKAALLSQKDLAREAGVSKPLLINFFRKMGYPDYRSFQQGIEQFFGGHIDSFRASEAVHARVTTISGMVEQALAVDVRTLERLRRTIPEAVLQEFAGHVGAGGAVYVMGPGTGWYPAHYLAQRIRRYRTPGALISQDTTHAIDELYPLRSDDVLIIFHYTQRDDWLLPVLRFAGERATRTLLVAATIHPQFVTESTYFVHIPRGEVRFKNSMSAPMAFANLLLLSVEVVQDVAAREQLRELEESRETWVRETRRGGNYA